MPYQSIASQINSTPYKVFVTVSGGGQSFANEYLKFSGASKTIAGIHIPYGKQAFEDFVGEVDKFVSPETARLLAKKSYSECVKQVDAEHAIGIGVTCVLATDNEREGRLHKIILALHGFEYTRLVNVELNQGLSREDEEKLACDMIFNVLSQYALKKDLFIDEYNDVNQYVSEFKQDIKFRHEFDSVIDNDAIAIAPGSFNPFHDGHQQMLDVAEEILGYKPYAELAVLNVDKGALDYFDVEKRFSTMSGVKTLLTSASTFKEKTRKFAAQGRSITFIVGSDTWNRILDPKYAGDTESLYSYFKAADVKFMVFNRDGSEIKTDEWLDQLLVIDDRLTDFNNPVSSSQIREGMRP